MRRRTFNILSALAVASQPQFLEAQPAGQPRRKNIAASTTELPDLTDYRRAVRLMKDLPQTDPRNWVKQAAIHQDFCPHNNWWFLPWHRAYLAYFERICRDVLQKPAFALPYWDWTAFPNFPGAFQDQNSSLYNPGRNRNGAPVLSDVFVGRSVINTLLRTNSIPAIYSGPTRTDDQREQSSTGQLEASPHNHVHGAVGGDMGTYMSPLDPVFWLHHCNVDRLWTSWLELHQDAAPAEGLWQNHKMASFYDPATRTTSAPTVKSVLAAGAWGAQYDRLENLTGGLLTLGPRSRSVAFSESALLRRGSQNAKFSVAEVDGAIELLSTKQVKVEPNRDLASLLDVASLSSTSTNTTTLPEVLLVIDGIVQPETPTVAIRVFINCASPSLATPIDDPSYVATLAFFADHHPNDQGKSFILDVRDTLARLRALGTYSSGGSLDVALLPYDTANLQRSGERITPRSVRFLGLQ